MTFCTFLDIFWILLDAFLLHLGNILHLFGDRFSALLPLHLDLRQITES